uniref:Uncharacterized protein n=1 Tax=Trichogramma kaykai TaxID=54128 RepID=A0ABD2W770_9HYME
MDTESEIKFAIIMCPDDKVRRYCQPIEVIFDNKKDNHIQPKSCTDFVKNKLYNVYWRVCNKNCKIEDKCCSFYKGQIISLGDSEQKAWDNANKNQNRIIWKKKYSSSEQTESTDENVDTTKVKIDKAKQIAEAVAKNVSKQLRSEHIKNKYKENVFMQNRIVLADIEIEDNHEINEIPKKICSVSIERLPDDIIKSYSEKEPNIRKKTRTLFQERDPILNDRGQVLILIQKLSLLEQDLKLIQWEMDVNEDQPMPEEFIASISDLIEQDIEEVICYECSADLGTDRLEKITRPICKAANDRNDQQKSSYFVLLDPSEQIIDLVKQHEDYSIKVTQEPSHELSYLSDVYDGIKYHFVMDQYLIKDYLEYEEKYNNYLQELKPDNLEDLCDNLKKLNLTSKKIQKKPKKVTKICIDEFKLRITDGRYKLDITLRTDSDSINIERGSHLEMVAELDYSDKSFVLTIAGLDNIKLLSSEKMSIDDIIKVAKKWEKLKIVGHESILEKSYALAHLPSDKIQEGLKHITALIDNLNDEKLVRFGTYMRNQWGPLKNILSIYQNPVRTNNTCENFHMHAKRRIGKHETVWKMLNGLKEVIEDIGIKYDNVCKGFTPKCWRPMNLQLTDTAILNFEREFGNGRTSVEEFMFQIASLKRIHLSRGL